MKKIVFFLAVFLMVTSCDLDDTPKSESVALPIESVTIPSQWPLNQLGDIKITYRRPTTCHLFNGFNYQYTNEFERTVNIESIKLNENNCLDASMEVYEVDLSFKPKTIGIYHFKFWSGFDEDGNYTFLEYDVDVQ